MSNIQVASNSMPSSVVNVLVTSFYGLGLPPTLAVPVTSSMTISALKSLIISRFPYINSRLLFTTTSNKELISSSDPISSLLLDNADDLLPLRLSVPLCGGKGGFGSQLRAAGGRMSSKRKKNRGDDNGSSRNLDGRRLRTVTEAKALAEYLAVKPEMEKQEKEARRKRWEQVVEMAERREEEIRSGSKGKVDGQWKEDKDEAAERTREAVMMAMYSGNYTDNSFTHLHGNPSETADREASGEVSDRTEELEAVVGESSSATMTPPSVTKLSSTTRSYFGFDDDDDDFMSDEEDADECGGSDKCQGGRD